MHRLLIWTPKIASNWLSASWLSATNRAFTSEFEWQGLWVILAGLILPQVRSDLWHWKTREQRDKGYKNEKELPILIILSAFLLTKWCFSLWLIFYSGQRNVGLEATFHLKAFRCLFHQGLFPNTELCRGCWKLKSRLRNEWLYAKQVCWGRVSLVDEWCFPHSSQIIPFIEIGLCKHKLGCGCVINSMSWFVLLHSWLGVWTALRLLSSSHPELSSFDVFSMVSFSF